MPIEDFELKESLGKGSFGSVCKCVRKSDGEVYAMKQVFIFSPRLNFKSLKRRIKKMPLMKSAFLHPLSRPLWLATKKLSMMKNHKCSVSSWSLQTKETYKAGSKKPSTLKAEFLKNRFGRSHIMYWKD